MESSASTHFCPSCESSLKKLPQRKTKCTSCGCSIYVRTRSSDGLRLLLSEEGAAKFDAEREKEYFKNRLPLPNKNEVFDAERSVLLDKFGGPPRDADVFWSLLLKERMTHASKREWGLYRNSTFDLACVLIREDRYLQAAPYVLDVCLLDCWLEEKLERELKLPSSPLSKHLATGIIDILVTTLKYANMSLDDVLSDLDVRKSKLPMLSRWSVDLQALRRAIETVARR